ncbi:MAG: hypothetical protein HUU41_08145 [Bryobacteraceae bacterium]|nr:hypothetical protein [Bryobacterales bacterium]MEB2361236.1 hypothetical protein [Bryobacterales bacterium]NUN01069.1 hypothetical protein [Bryobacteraceae bacterium]
MRNSIRTFFAAALLLAAATQLPAGGLHVMLGNPEASPEARKHNAVLTIILAGCHEPEKAPVEGAAITVVDGKRQTIPIQLIALSKPGMYAVTRQWPARGRWVLQFVAKDRGRVASTLVAATPDKIERHSAKMAMRLPSEKDLAALLSGGDKPEVARK